MNQPDGPIPYSEWLRDRIANPGLDCGPDIVDDRSWWQYLPGLNRHAALERQVRAAGRQADREAGS